MDSSSLKRMIAKKLIVTMLQDKAEELLHGVLKVKDSAYCLGGCFGKVVY